jgi:hypothetical protein
VDLPCEHAACGAVHSSGGDPVRSGQHELVEAYPDDKYLPSYLILARHGPEAFHVLFAADVEDDNVRVVTSYRPDPREWPPDLKARRPSR